VTNLGTLSRFRVNSYHRLALDDVTEHERVDLRERFAESEAFIAEYASKPLEEYETDFEHYLRRIGKFIQLRPGMRVLEVGAGSGWFMVLCRRRGFACDGVEHNPFCVEHAKELGRRHGVELSIREENIETVQLPEQEYDLVIAMSVLEHVEDYERALSNIYRTLKPGGVFVGNSTNKFSLRSGEYPRLFYGWLPYSLRRAIRVRRHGGPGIVTSSGMDFNQFTYFSIKRALRRAGFAHVYDKFDFLKPEDVVRRTWWRLSAARALRAIPPLRTAARIIDHGTSFVGVK
jgi:ubiquinone/menaquinone biosynthesis C-methylase UbiE